MRHEGSPSCDCQTSFKFLRAAARIDARDVFLRASPGEHRIGKYGQESLEGVGSCRAGYSRAAAAFLRPPRRCRSWPSPVPPTARSISGTLPWKAFAGEPPKPVNPLGWYFFTPGEAATVEAIVDRLIPADHLSPGGKDAGCAVFIDRQLAGSFGKSSRLYTKGPFCQGLPTQGYQGELTPAGRYRLGLARAERLCPRHLRNKSFAQLTAAQQDDVLTGLGKRQDRRSSWRPASAPGHSSNWCCRTRWKASSPIRSMAATRAWRAGRWSAFPARATTIATISTSTMCPIRMGRSRSTARRDLRHGEAAAAARTS